VDDGPQEVAAVAAADPPKLVRTAPHGAVINRIDLDIEWFCLVGADCGRLWERVSASDTTEERRPEVSRCIAHRSALLCGDDPTDQFLKMGNVRGTADGELPAPPKRDENLIDRLSQVPQVAPKRTTCAQTGIPADSSAFSGNRQT
jgi:diadenosine tetraphosphatase ApaH/serine/threonine PP2A family protein phosphatase